MIQSLWTTPHDRASDPRRNPVVFRSVPKHRPSLGVDDFFVRVPDSPTDPLLSRAQRWCLWATRSDRVNHGGTPLREPCWTEGIAPALSRAIIPCCAGPSCAGPVTGERGWGEVWFPPHPAFGHLLPHSRVWSQVRGPIVGAKGACGAFPSRGDIRINSSRGTAPQRGGRMLLRPAARVPRSPSARCLSPCPCR